MNSLIIIKIAVTLNLLMMTTESVLMVKVYNCSIDWEDINSYLIYCFYDEKKREYSK